MIGHDVTGGCDVHVVSEQETQIVAGTAGGPVVVLTCEDEFDATIDANGHGSIHESSPRDTSAPRAPAPRATKLTARRSPGKSSWSKTPAAHLCT